MDSSLFGTSGNLTERVLVIDDDIVMRELLSVLLEEPGHHVTTAESGEAALALLSTLPSGVPPSVLLVDLTLPGLSHDALASQLRAASPPPSLLIAMSGSEPSATEKAAFDEFLLKPFTVEDLDAAIERARRRFGNSVQPVRSARRTAATKAIQPPAIIDQALFAKLAAVMGPVQLPQLYKMFLDDAPVRLARMRAAAEAGDEATYIREAHTLKGGCGMLGATELQALAERAESGGVATSLLLDDFLPALERVRSILEKHPSQ